MESILNPQGQGLSKLLSGVDPRYRHTLGEAQGWEEIRLRQQSLELMKKLHSLYAFPPLSLGLHNQDGFKIEKRSSGEVLSFACPYKDQDEKIKELIKGLTPWRKGPYAIGHHVIDSEWDSSIKWNRLKNPIKKIISGGETIADIGSNNGYFLFRLLHEFQSYSQLSLVVGFDPLYRNALQYLLLNSLVRHPQIVFLLLGYKALQYFFQGFDVILCLGILYHHPDPIGILRLIAKALKPGGWVVIDCQGISGRDPLTWFPQHRYTGKRNFWFLPTSCTLIHWLERMGYRDIQIWGEYPLGKEEQRTTPLAPGDSLAEGLFNPQDYYTHYGKEENEKNEKVFTTIEGYPPPIRIYLGARV